MAIMGVGKTTLVKHCVNVLKENGIKIDGFFTEEVRDGGKRIGFDVVTLDLQRTVLSRIEEDNTFGKKSQPMVGQYTVNVNEFECLAIPAISMKGDKKQVVVIDEIGKMELFSKNFIRTVRTVMKGENSTVFGTIPVARGKPIPFVEEVRNDKNVVVFEITRENRNTIKEEILKTLLQICT